MRDNRAEGDVGMRSLAALALLAVMAGCAENDQRERAEPIDYDAMNLEAEGPAWPIKPEALATGELANLGLSGVTCIVPGENRRENLYAATRKKGIMRLETEILEFAPRPTAILLPYDISDSFDGLIYKVELTIDRGSETEAGPGLLFYNGQMTVRDARERIVFQHRGRIECGAEA